MCRRILGWLLGPLCGALLPTLAFGLVVNGYTAPRNNRFSSGYPNPGGPPLTYTPVANADPSFIGSGYDWSGVGWRADEYIRGYVLLGPRHYLYANHFPAGAGAGATIDFTPADGVLKGYTVQAQSGSLSGDPAQPTDLAVGTLAVAIPKSDNVHPIPILFQGYTATPYVGKNLLQYGWTSTIGWNQINNYNAPQGFVQFGGDSGYYWDFSFDATTPDRASLVSGDSGSPSFIVTGPPGQMYVAGAHYAKEPLEGFDSAVPRMLPSLTGYMAQTGYLPYVVTSVTARWTSNSSGEWGVKNNWSTNKVPADVFLPDYFSPYTNVLTTPAAVLFDAAAGTQRTINLGGDQQVTGIVFNSAANGTSGSNGFIFSAGDTLTIGEAGLSNRDDDPQTLHGNIALRPPPSLGVVSTGSQRWDVGRGGLTVTGTIDTGSSTPGNLLLIEGDGNTTLSGAISGTGSLAKDGAGTLTLSSPVSTPNSYSGKTFINGGTLAVSRDDHLGAAPSTPVADQLTINGGTLQATTAADVFNLAANRGITLGSLGGTILVDAGKTLTANSVIAGAAATLNKAGSGNLVLTAANSYSGATGVREGTFTLSGGNGAAAASSAFAVYHGATLRLDNSAGNHANRIGDAAAINLNGGTLTFVGSGSAPSSETVGVLTPQVDASTVSVTGGAGGNAATLTFAGLGTRNSTTNAAATVNFLLGPNNSVQLQGSDPRLNGIIGGYAVVNGVDWATVAGGASPWPVVALSSYTEIPASNPGIGSTATNYIVSSSDKTLNIAFAANSLKLSGAAPRTLDLAGFDFTTNTFGPNIFGIISDGGGTGHTITGGGVFANGAGELVTHVNSGTLTINTRILGASGALTKAGSGTLILGNTGNNYSGPTAVTGGTLSFGAAGAMSAASALLVNGAAQVDLAGYSQTVPGLIVADNGAVGNTGLPATLSLGDNTGMVFYFGVSGGGTISVDALNLATTGAAAASHTFTVGNAAAARLTITSIIADGTAAGAQSLLKAGVGTLILSGSNSYSGGTTINAGTLALGNSNVIPSTSPVTVSGGTLAMGGYANTVGSLSLQGGSITGPGTLSTAGSLDVQSGTIAAALGGLAQLAKSTSGTVTLSGNNAYSGGTNLNAGTLSVGSDLSLGDPGGALNFNGGILQITGSGFTGTARSIHWSPSGGGFDVGGEGIAYAAGVAAPNTFTLSSSQPLADAGPLTKLGIGLLTLNGSVGSSAITIQDGTLKLGAAALLAGGVAVVVSNAGTLQLHGLSGENDTIGSLTMTGGQVKTTAGTLTLGGDVTGNQSIWPATISGKLDLGGATRTFNVTAGSSGTDLTVSANILGSGSSLVKAGTGSLLLGGGNTYSGNTTVQAGVLRFQGTGAIPGTSIITAQSGGYAGLAVAVTQANFLDKFDKANTAGTVGLDADSSNISLAANGGFNANARLGSSTAAVLSGTFTPQGSQYRFGGGGGTLTVASILGDSGGSRSLDMGTSGSLLAGVLVLSGANTYTGPTTIGAGTLRLANSSALGTPDSGTTVGSGAVLDFDGQTVGNDVWPQNETLTISGSGLGGLGAVINSSTSTAALSGDVILAGDSTIGTLGTVAGGGDISLSGAISGSFGLTKAGPATLILSGPNGNTYSGTTTVGAGTLKLGKATALGSTVGGTNVMYGAVLDLNGQAVGNENVWIAGAGLTNSSTTPAGLGGSLTLTMNSSIGGNGDITLGGPVSGSYNLTKIGSAALILNGASSSYNGVVTVSSGTLRLGNAAALGSTVGNTVVSSGAVLDLNGQAIANEAVTISGTGIGNGGALTNSNGITDAVLGGTLTLASASSLGGNGNLTLAGPLLSNFNLTKLGSGTLTVRGPQNWGSGTTLLFGSGSPPSPFAGDGTAGGSGGAAGSGPPTYLARPGAGVPEPAGWAMLLAAGAALLVWRGRRKGTEAQRHRGTEAQRGIGD